MSFGTIQPSLDWHPSVGNACLRGLEARFPGQELVVVVAAQVVVAVVALA